MDRKSRRGRKGSLRKAHPRAWRPFKRSATLPISSTGGIAASLLASRARHPRRYRPRFRGRSCCVLALKVAADVFVAVAMALALAHALEYPGKMRLDRSTYVAMQPI